MKKGIRHIVVKGTGTVSKAPDIFGISFDVQAHERSYTDSLKKLNRRVEDLRKAVEAAGIERSTLKTSSFRISSDYKYNKDLEERQFNGYIASHKLKIEFPVDKEKSNRLLGEIVDKARHANFQIYFTVSNPEELKDEMVKEAVINATRKAEIMTEAAGVKLGKILSINYTWGEVHFRSEFGADLLCASMIETEARPDFEPEEIEESDNVEVVWELVD